MKKAPRFAFRRPTSGALKSSLIALTCGGVVAGLSGCAPEPSPVRSPETANPVRIVVDGSRPGQVVIGTLVNRGLKEKGRESFLVDNNKNTVRETGPDVEGVGPVLRAVEEGRGDLMVTCTGAMLYELNPDLATELSKKYVSEKQAGNVDLNDGEWRDEIYKAMVANLPGSLSATDPSNAIACKDNYKGPELPQNMVPVYRKPVLNREERGVLNVIGGTLTTDKLNELRSQATSNEAVDKLADEFVAEIGF